MRLSDKEPDWDWEEQQRLKETKCERCSFPCDDDDEHFCEIFNPDGGTGH
ncbi:MAG: hypothetical protein KAI71_05970 [Candidatus Pacebacteria bacterium]|nr:hypothetical protein [Candidatus Paceibacterota bacterium]